MNGKGDKPRNNMSESYRNNYDDIFRKKSEDPKVTRGGYNLWHRKLVELKYKDVDDDDDHMTVKYWLGQVYDSSFIDYDGHGVWATKNKKSNATVIPSDITERKLAPPDWATHVVWYNK